MLVYSEVGIASRLVGLGHIFFWLPAAIYGVIQIWRKELYKVESIYQGVFVVWLSVASTFFLVSNFWDVPDAVLFAANGCSFNTQSASCSNVELLDRIEDFRASN